MFIRNGEFHFDLSKQSHHLHTGHVLIDKPHYEYRLRPSAGECSIINFTQDFYQQFVEDLNLKYAFFFSNPNLLTLMLRTTPGMEYLHYQLFKNTAVGKLETDNRVIELLRAIVNAITEFPAEDELNAMLKKFHLATIEKAKEYINENFHRDISLFEIASFACVSPFHFSRIFKQFTLFSPHQYLQNIRLKHSEMLLKNSVLPIADVSFHSGFTTAEYFATSFRQKYGMTPTDFRKSLFG
jgi:AraC-like DNA-binding protein